MKLYEIAAEYRKIAAQLEENGGELSLDAEAALSSIQGELVNKARAITVLIREYTTEANAVGEEADRLKRLATTKANAADSLKGYLLNHLQGIGVDRLDVGIAKLSVQQAARPRIWWAGYEGAEFVPPAFARVKSELDSDKALAAYKSGTLPDGFTVKYSTFLGIR